MIPPVPAPLRSLVERGASAVRTFVDRTRPQDPRASTDLASHPDTAAYEAPGADPDGPAVLLCHGFSGTPQSLLPWARHLSAAGIAVSLPLLPGHATSWQDLNATPWTAWYHEVETALLRLRAQHRTVVVAGLSMGSALALRLAQQHPDAVAGLVLVNPCINITDPRIKILPLLCRLTPSLAAIAGDIAKPDQLELAYARTPLVALQSQTRLWADVRAHLDAITQPLLVYTSETDHVVDPSSLALITAGVRSVDQTYVTLTRSYHVATLDHEADDIFAGSLEFVRRLDGDGSAGPEDRARAGG